jgi:hypothetical protein
MAFLIALFRTLDVFMDITLKIVGIYFLIHRDWINGAIMLGASGMYSCSMAFGLLLRKTLKPDSSQS